MLRSRNVTVFVLLGVFRVSPRLGVLLRPTRGLGLWLALMTLLVLGSVEDLVFRILLVLVLELLLVRVSTVLRIDLVFPVEVAIHGVMSILLLLLTGLSGIGVAVRPALQWRSDQAEVRFLVLYLLALLEVSCVVTLEVSLWFL